MDKGLSLTQIEGLFATAGDYVDIVKLGWGTSYVTQNLPEKLALYRSLGVPVVCGGTLLEAAEARGKLDAYRSWLSENGFECVEVSDGTIDMPRERKLEIIETARAGLPRALRGRHEGRRGDLRALPVGRVDQGGARRRRLEGDHGGARVGHRGHLPRLRRGAQRADRRDRARAPRRALLFEAPQKSQQAWFIRHFGPEVNLGNIPPEEVIPLETLRLGLRSDTMSALLRGVLIDLHSHSSASDGALAPDRARRARARARHRARSR